MTRLPSDNWSVKGVEGPKYKVDSKCANPHCHRYSDHAHHIWRRSFLGGDFKWVQLWDGEIVQNLAGLCWYCHKEVTENRWSILYDGFDRTFVFHAGGQAAPLRPQPQTLGGRESLSPDPAEPMQLTVDGDEVPHAEVCEDETSCPTCGHVKKRRRKEELPPGEKRARRTWSVSVPKDSQEDGADVLDSLLYECAKLLGRDEDGVWKYFTLAEALALVVQHGHLMVKE